MGKQLDPLHAYIYLSLRAPGWFARLEQDLIRADLIPKGRPCSHKKAAKWPKYAVFYYLALLSAWKLWEVISTNPALW